MFKRYNSIENSYRDEFLERIKGHGFWDDEFIVQEKAHGANLSYWTTNGLDFQAAKRTSTIGSDEKFYNHHLILEELKPKFVNIWNAVKASREELNQLTFFGEVIGGNYPHKEVQKDNQSIKVQKGVYYSPLNHFFAFDIMINATMYLDAEEVKALFEKEQLLYAKTLFKGTITDCLNYPNSFESKIPEQLGLPELKPNICEGVIIKPVKTSYFNNGVRVILKNKNEQWAENTKYHKTIKKEEQLSEKVLKLQEAILTYVTENRLNNVISKIGEVTQKDIGKVMGLFNKDIFEDFSKDYRHIIEDLEKKEIKAITKSVNKTTIAMVKKMCR